MRFLCARSRENAPEADVALVTRDLIDPAIRSPQPIHERPRLRECLWIGHRQPLLDRVRVEHRESLDEMQLRARAAEHLLLVEIRGLDDERAPLPPSA